MRLFVLVFLASLAVVGIAPATAVAADVVSGTVLSNNDGDTLVLRSDTKSVRVRLWGVDAPESAQDGGPAAKEFTHAFAVGKQATAHILDEDQYGRLVCEVFVEGRSLNRELARAGHAWWYSTFAGSDHDLRDLVAAARSSRQGLWAADSPVPPWEWRRAHLHHLAGGFADIDIESAFAARAATAAGATAGIGGSATADTSPAVPANLRGHELLRELQRLAAPTSTLGYSGARRQMFSRIDNRDGRVRCVYTGALVTTSGIPSDGDMNTEHTWPQSRFASSNRRGDIKSDLHHLYPTLTKVNSERGSKPFAEIADTETEWWWISKTGSGSIPAHDIDAYSESEATSFEPREDHKGNVARSILYVAVAYWNTGIDVAWLRPQLDTLVSWSARDPVDDVETQRDAEIRAVQGNSNPLVAHPELVERVAEAVRGTP